MVKKTKSLAPKPSVLLATSGLHDQGALLLRGLVLHQQGQLIQAKEIYQQVIRAQPGNSDALQLLGTLHRQIGEPELAVQLIGKAIALKPNFAEAYSNRGLALEELKRFEDALADHERAIALKPEYVQAFNNRGKLLCDMGRLEEALASYEKALSKRADYALAHNGRGQVLERMSRYEEALSSLDMAIKIDPQLDIAHTNRGNALKGLNRLEEALASHDNAIAINPHLAEAFSNRGNVLKDLMRLEEALQSYEQAIALKPDYADALYSRGKVLHKLIRLDKALASYDKLIETKPDHVGAHNNRGNVLTDVGRLQEAQASYRDALRLKPDSSAAHSNLLFTLNYLGALTPASVLAEARCYGAWVSKKAQAKFTSWILEPEPARLRIGLVSGDLRSHSVGYFVEGLIQHLNKSHFELFAFPTTAECDDLTERVRPEFQDWVPLYGKSDQDAAALIHQQGIHVLIDLSGHTANNRLPVFAYKPAPVQVSWLGLPMTTGIPEMDYVLGDLHALPQQFEPHFTERVWRLPGSYICLTPPDISVAVAALPALSNDHITFASFNNLSKINDEVVQVWSRILHALPGSKLLLKTKQLVDSNLSLKTERRFTAHGIASDRLKLIGRHRSRTDHLCEYNNVDIALDTFPYPGVTTSAEALWMGVPVLSMRGDRFLSATAASIAKNAGLTDWIAQDADDYVNKAVGFAADLQALAQLRASLKERVLTSPLFDVPSFARNFGDALWGMWQQIAKDPK